ncbi:MAG: hypothetical protein CVV64_03625 [Candidatus Wallbacteria bacterium HGW-Wallbacteria-1]|jgi:anti-sigma B factor antagonist|uniref:Anti-sigma factor antagonist n=1 Tax=Candidatus Wallbacteria bacterium HGW-Wallbacteria-1 TaxID=2013854 RepID=A0A2N1PTU0_9BACT|nr:MAG: hypothetical protein CVV64_03625 [Candidatus Wallbacteria bacterium HGW-Wallbacteria-1]
MNIEISLEEAGEDILLVKLKGMVDSESEPELQSALSDSFRDGRRKYVIDFGGVSYLNSKGLGVIASLLKKVRKEQGDVKLINLAPSIHELFTITRLTNIFRIHETLQDAVLDFSDEKPMDGDPVSGEPSIG